VKVEGGKSNGKEVKRKREDDGDVIEVLSDDGDLDSLQVLCIASHAFRIPDEI